MNFINIVKTAFLVLLLPAVMQANFSIVTWNIKDFGQSRNDSEIRDIAKVVRHADIVAIQEVVAKHPGGAQAVARLADELNRMGAKWDYSISDPTKGSSSHKSERYAFLWKTSKLTVTGGGPRLLSELDHNVEREPYLIQFKASGKVLTVINYHACTHTPDYPERGEIIAISSWLGSRNFENTILMGDVNLEIDDEAWRPLLAYGYKNVLKGEKTTLKTVCKAGDYLSSDEDNIFHRLSDFNYHSFKILDFVASGDCRDVEWKRVSYSDHLPVSIKIL